MAFSVNEIRSQLALGGARASLFQVTITNPVNSIGDLKAPFMIKAAAVPAATIGTIEFPYFGRKVKLAGDRTYAEWQVTIINDEDFLVRNALEEWSNAINSFEGNVSLAGSASPLLYKSQAEITQFSKTGAPVRTYKFHGLWPSEIGQIDLAWETTDTIQEFPVTFQYDYWTVSGGVTGDAGGS